MPDNHRLSHEVTVARASEPDQTQVRPGGPPGTAMVAGPPRAPKVPPAQPKAGDGVTLQTRIESRSLLAEGGMAMVYRAADHSLGREVAMKVLKPDASRSVIAGFEQEARLMARLDHPGIVGVYGLTAPDDPARIFTMKLVEGRTIAEIIDAGRPPRGRALAVMLRSVLKMCETLAYAHDHRVIHRDLKPENVMIGRYGECFIMDWGVALELGKRDSLDEHEIIGTPAFMPPEQANGRVADIDERTDIFGLGAILYYILTGEPPYPETTLTAVLASARAGETRPPDLAVPELPIPARLSDIVSKALAREREDRFQTATELHDALEQFLFAGDWFARRRFEAGDLIFREGERGDRAFIVESGECEVFRVGERGEISLARIGAGEVIGELALFTASGRTASVRALTPMTLLEVTRDALERELPAGSWTRQIIDTLARRFMAVEVAKKR